MNVELYKELLAAARAFLDASPDDVPGTLDRLARIVETIDDKGNVIPFRRPK